MAPGTIARRRALLALAATAALLAGCAGQPPGATGDAARLARIGHVVVIYAENHSFDNMYGLFPGANGISRATPAQYTQLDHDGRPLPGLVIFGPDGKPDRRFPRMPNRPFRIDAPPIDKPPTEIALSPIHVFFHNIEQIDGGRNDMFAAMSNVGGWTLGYYDGSVFRLADGRVERGPASVPQPRYAVRVLDGRVEVRRERPPAANAPGF